MKPFLWVLVACLWIGCGDDDGGRPDAGPDANADGSSTSCATACDDGVYCNGQELCDPTDARANAMGCVRVPIDCDDNIACTTDSCSESISGCVNQAPDDDEDGHRSAACLGPQAEPLGDDCDDDDPTRYPGHAEVCDDEGVDEDCNPRTFGTTDNDGDGSVDAACFNLDEDGARVGGLDCNDDNLAIHSRQVELCDTIDNDCDLIVDEYPRVVSWYLDGDGDGFGSGSDAVESCDVISGRSILGSDCDDTSASVHPGAGEECDAEDNDCDLRVDEALIDCETSGEPEPPIVNACLNGLDDCHEYATCTDMADGGFTCACNDGFRGMGHGPSGCSDINECAPGPQQACGLGAYACLNGLGSYACFCDAGFSGTGSQACVDIDECAIDNGGCDVERTCVNTAPGRTCAACDVGYVAVGSTSCAPVLIDLVASAGLLSPALSPTDTAYALNAGTVDPSVTLTPTAAPGVTITINGQLVVSGTPWQSPLLSQATTIGIVLSESARPTRYYTVSMQRPLQATFIKASNTEPNDLFGAWVSLSDDGNTMAVAALGEDSSTSGIDGDQTSNAAAQSGAVYVYRRTAGVWAQEAYIKASNTDANDNFGRAVTLSGDGNTLAVNGYFESSSAGGIDGNQSLNDLGSSGAVYVYTRNAGVWTQQAYLKSDTPAGSHLFGAAIALSDNGNVLVAGTPQDDNNAAGVYASYTFTSGGNETGAAYVFERSGSTWQETAYLKASNPNSLDYFGNQLAISGDGGTIVVSARGEASAATGINGNQGDNTLTRAGAAYVFVRSGMTWAQEAYVKASNSNTQDNFGSALGLSRDGNVLAIGALQESSAATGIGGNQGDNNAANAGAVYLFARAGTVWSQTTYIKASNTDAGDNFGTGLSLSNDGTRLAVAALNEDSAAIGVDGNQLANNATDAGAVYLFSRASGSWAQTAYVKSRNTETLDHFGSVALSGDATTLAVGSPDEDSASTGIDGTTSNSATSSGAVYVY